MRQKADLIQYPIWQKPTTATAQEGHTDISLKQSNRWSGAPARVRLQGSRVNVTTTISVQEEALGFKIVKETKGAERKRRFCSLLFNIL